MTGDIKSRLGLGVRSKSVQNITRPCFLSNTMRRRNNLGSHKNKNNFSAEKCTCNSLCLLRGKREKILPSSRLKGKRKCLLVTGSSRCSKCYCCEEVVIFFFQTWCLSTVLFAMESNLCVWVQTSRFMTNINIGWHQWNASPGIWFELDFTLSMNVMWTEL